jgi:hypothetical protein
MARSFLCHIVFSNRTNTKGDDEFGLGKDTHGGGGDRGLLFIGSMESLQIFDFVTVARRR